MGNPSLGSLKQSLKNRFGKSLKENKFVLVFLFLLSSLSFYTWFNWPAGDQTLHIPMIYQLIDNSLFSRDYFIIAANQNYASTFHHFMAAISTVNNLFYTYLSIAFILNIIFTFSIFLLAKQISHNTIIALLATVILSFYRGSLEGVEISAVILSPRTFVLAFVPLIIYLYTRNIQNYSRIRALIIFALLGLLYNIHPVGALPIIIVTLGTDILYFKRLDGVYFAILIFILTLPANLHYLAVQTASPSGEALQEIIRLRTPYHSFEHRIELLLGTLIYAPILAGIAYYMKHGERTGIDKILLSWIIFFCSFSILFIFISNFVSHEIIFYMLPRAWKYGYILSIIYAVVLASLLWNKGRWRKFPLSKVSAILIVIFLLSSQFPITKFSPVEIALHYVKVPLTPVLDALVFNYEKPFGRIYYDSFCDSDNEYLKWACKYIEPSKKNQELKDIGDWMKKNTDKDALVMSYPPGFVELRTYSQRSMLVTPKDGALGMFSEEVFRKWWELSNEVKNGEPLEVADKYDVDFILTDSSINLPLEKAYCTEHFNLYRTW